MTLNIGITEDRWEPVNDGDPALLHCGDFLVINSISFHAWAFLVVTDDPEWPNEPRLTASGDSTFQRAPDVSNDIVLDALHEAFHPDGGWQTITIGERGYVVFLEPHSR